MGEESVSWVDVLVLCIVVVGSVCYSVRSVLIVSRWVLMVCFIFNKLKLLLMV